MKKIYSLLALALLFHLSGYAGTFTSKGNGGGAWTGGAATWNIVADADGIPDLDDDVTILAGDNITWNTTNKCHNFTVQGTLTGSVSGAVIYISGDCVISGTEAGTGQLVFQGVNKTVTATGTLGLNFPRWFFYANTTILSPSVITKTVVTISANVTIHNQGNFTLNSVTAGTGSSWLNEANSSLTINVAGFMAGKTFDASFVPNTVTLKYATGAVPTTTAGYYNLTLAATTSGTKTLGGNTIVAKNLTMNTANNLNSNNFDLTVGGNWTNSATFTASAGKTVTMNGTTAQTMSNSLGTTTFTKLTLNNTAGVTLTSGTYMLTEVLTVSNGTFNTGGKSFTMTSTATKTARIAPITGTGAISGSFTVQRFLSTRTQSPTDSPGHWSDLSSPVQNSTMADWGNELFFSYPHTPPTVYSNVLAYSEPADDYVGVTGSTTLSPGQGFEIALADDGTLSSFTAKTLTTIGVPNQGDQHLSARVSFAGAGSNLVGNPFASSIAWSNVLAASSGILNTYDEYDANAASYVTAGAGTEIGAGQGFWVYTTSGSATFNIPESAKTTSSNSTIKSQQKNEPYLSLKLAGADPGNYYAHTLKIAADASASDNWDLMDHPFRKSPAKHACKITSKTADGKELSINTFNSGNDNVDLALTTLVGVSGNYTIETNGLDNISEYSCVMLEDKSTGKWYDLSKSGIISVEMRENENDQRFVLHLSKNSNCRASMPADQFASEFETNVQILPAQNGNMIRFNFDQTTPVTISVINLLGQQIIETKSLKASVQDEFIGIPEEFSGMYLIRVSNGSENVVKKFVKK